MGYNVNICNYHQGRRTKEEGFRIYENIVKVGVHADKMPDIGVTARMYVCGTFIYPYANSDFFEAILEE